jgi:hypothetical protein
MVGDRFTQGLWQLERQLEMRQRLANQEIWVSGLSQMGQRREGC